jgi:hypothetical protein
MLAAAEMQGQPAQRKLLSVLDHSEAAQSVSMLKCVGN